MKKVLIMLLVIGWASCGIGLGTALGATPVLTGVKLGTGTHPDAGVTVSPDGNTYTVKGTGNDIWNAADSAQYAFVQVSGNFDISCRVASFVSTNTTDGWSKAGIMVRQNANTDGVSPFVYIVASLDGDGGLNNGLSWASRNTNGTLSSYSAMAYVIPVYLRLTRVGNVFNAYYSQDGLAWTKVPGNAAQPGDFGFATALTDPIYVGLTACPHREVAANPTAIPPVLYETHLATAEFDTIQFNYGAAAPTPANGAPGIDYPAAIQLKWDAFANTDGAIKDWTVYFGNSPHDPNVAKIEPTLNEPTREITSPALEPDKTYYWRVDATNTVNSDVSRGFWWSFSTKSAKPVISPLVNVSAAVNCLVTLNAKATSGAYSDQGDMTFVWKKSDGTILKIDGPGIAVTSSYSQAVSVKNDPNTFFVEVTNKNGTTKSNEVRISINPGTPSFQFTHLINATNGGVIAAGTGGSRTGNTYTLIGSGDDIWNTADSCEFAYIPVSGDGILTVRVASLVGNSGDGGWTKAGPMIRGSLDANAQEVSMLASTLTDASNGNRSTFQVRPTIGAASTSSYAVLGTAVPKWERVVRVGNVFTAFYSTDGVTWTQQGSATTVAMPTDAYVGLAITAHSVANISTATFDNISMTFATSVKSWQAINPVVSPLNTKGWIDPTKLATLSWTKADGAPCGSSYKVYYGASPTTVTTLLGATGVDVFKMDAPANTFPFDVTIYWRVDTVLGPDTVTGTVWSFDTVKRDPIIITHPAIQTVVKAGMPVNLNVVAYSVTAPEFILLDKYEWFQVRLGVTTKVFEGTPTPKWTTPDVSDPLWGQYDCPLALTDVQLAKEGDYYCVVTNRIKSTTSNKGLVLTNRMMLHYTFESVTGTTIPDQSESKIDATLITPTVGGNPSYSLVDGGLGLGKAIRLIGNADPNGAYITTNKKPLELGINAGLPRSVSVWAKPEAHNGGLFDCGAYVTGQEFCLRAVEGTVNRWRVQYSAMDRDTDVVPSLQNWIHFVLVFDGVNSQLYVNGQLAKDINGAYINYASPLNTDNTNDFTLGRYQITALDAQYFVGLLDDFRLFNYALTAQEAANLYLAVKGGIVCPAPMLYDLDGDCQVDLRDFAVFAAQWARTGVAKP
jgi:hypothetical protein